MEKASWLQTGQRISNPDTGRAMSNCGEFKSWTFRSSSARLGGWWNENERSSPVPHQFIMPPHSCANSWGISLAAAYWGMVSLQAGEPLGRKTHWIWWLKHRARGGSRSPAGAL